MISANVLALAAIVSGSLLLIASTGSPGGRMTRHARLRAVLSFCGFALLLGGLGARYVTHAGFDGGICARTAVSGLQSPSPPRCYHGAPWPPKAGSSR